MILLAISNLLTRATMHQRFHAVPMIAATERLMHGKMPAEIPVKRALRCRIWSSRRRPRSNSLLTAWFPSCPHPLQALIGAILLPPGDPRS